MNLESQSQLAEPPLTPALPPEYRGEGVHVATQQRIGLFPRLLKVKHAPLVGDDHVEQAVAVHIVDFKLRANAAVVVELVAGPTGFAIVAGEPSTFRAATVNRPP